MRRSFFLWLMPVAILMALYWHAQQAAADPFRPLLHSSPNTPMRFLCFLLLAASLDLALRYTTHTLPLYKRHGGIFAGVVAIVLLDMWLHSGNLSSLFLGALAAALGLALASLSFLRGRWLTGLGWWRGCRKRVDPARPLILVADPHWHDSIESLHEATRQHPHADWLFLGDVFSVWVGVPAMETEAQRSFLQWARERREAGCWVGLWMGNREYFLDRHACHFDLMGEGIGGLLPEEGLAWEHGDLVNGRDRMYRLWNLISRSAPIWLLARLLPGAWAQALARRLEGSMRATNLEWKAHFPTEAFQAAAAAESPRVFITGHFHEERTYPKSYALPWAHSGRFQLWKDGQITACGPF